MILSSWLLSQIILTHSLTREKFPDSLCLSWQNSAQCRGGTSALVFNGVFLNISIFINEVDGSERTGFERTGLPERTGRSGSILHSVAQWIEINRRETAVVSFDGVFLNMSVIDRANGDKIIRENSTQLSDQDATSGMVVQEDYYITQLEHGGGSCNCIDINFGSTCTSGGSNVTRLINVSYNDY